MDVKENIKTQDSYIANGILKDVGNVTDKSTFVTTYQPDGNISPSTGHGIISTSDGEIATYTGQDLGITDANELRNIEVLRSFILIRMENLHSLII